MVEKAISTTWFAKLFVIQDRSNLNDTSAITKNEIQETLQELSDVPAVFFDGNRANEYGYTNKEKYFRHAPFLF
jgi:hypothetical protein